MKLRTALCEMRSIMAPTPETTATIAKPQRALAAGKMLAVDGQQAQDCNQWNTSLVEFPFWGNEEAKWQTVWKSARTRTPINASTAITWKLPLSDPFGETRAVSENSAEQTAHTYKQIASSLLTVLEPSGLRTFLEWGYLIWGCLKCRIAQSHYGHLSHRRLPPSPPVLQGIITMKWHVQETLLRQ